MTGLLLSLSAVASLVPAGFMRADERPAGGVAWALLAVAIAGPAVWLVDNVGGGWRTGLAPALWLAILSSMVAFAGLVVVERGAARLAPLLVGYLVWLGFLATIWEHAPERPLVGAAPEGWLVAHILVAVFAYGLLTLAAVAGLAVFLQERALRAKRPTEFTRRLPSVAEGEALLARLLMASGTVLGLALLSGSSLSWFTAHRFVVFDHKTVLSFATFVAIGVLLIVHSRGGLSGRRAARYVLFAYLLLTLAYPGVKFVTDVLMG
ncbi:MAG: cytochrome c biogenesis protein CcsA [Rhodospirillales bacterium]|nr:cytochrome c biogenesis protein CcsA [Rhodospirillales bacterium]